MTAGQRNCNLAYGGSRFFTVLQKAKAAVL
jgi:hypothetical protein